MPKICYMLIAICLSTSACNQFPSEENNKNASPKAPETTSQSANTLAEFRNYLDTADADSLPDMGKAQQKFWELFPPESPLVEEGFKIFQRLHQKYVERCNRKLFRNAELQTVLSRFPLIHDQTLLPREYIDEQLREKIENQYPFALSELSKCAEAKVLFKSQEGSWFVAPDLNYYVHEVLKEYDFPFKVYLAFVNQEERDAIAEDAALFISWERLRQKIIRYEKFAGKYPDLPETQTDIVPKTQRFLSWYLKGMDNTPLDQSACQSWEKFLRENHDSQYYAQVQKQYAEFKDRIPKPDGRVDALLRKIQHAQPGNTIVVPAGSYNVDAVGGLRIVDKAGINITSQDRTVNVFSSQPNRVIVTIENCEDITLHGFTIYHQGRVACDAACITILNSRNITLDGNDIHGSGAYGVAVRGRENENIQIMNNTIHDCRYWGADMLCNRGKIVNNTFYNNGDGSNHIYISSSSKQIIQSDNTMR